MMGLAHANPTLTPTLTAILTPTLTPARITPTRHLQLIDARSRLSSWLDGATNSLTLTLTLTLALALALALALTLRP